MKHPVLSVCASFLLLCLSAGCHKKTHHAAPQQTAPTIPNRSPSAARGVQPIHPGGGAGSSAKDGRRSTGAATGSFGDTANSDLLRGQPLSTEVGLASWYGPPYAGRKGADGTVYDQNAMTAAHLTLPLGTVVRVTNLVSHQSVVVKVTDRGPFVPGRVIDLSLAAAKAAGVYRAGVVKVRVEAYSIPPLRPNVLPGGRWCVQIGAFSTEADAIQEKSDLSRRYPDSKVIQFAGPTGYWVRINPKLSDRHHASEIADSVHLPDAAQPYLIRTD